MTEQVVFLLNMVHDSVSSVDSLTVFLTVICRKSEKQKVKFWILGI